MHYNESSVPRWSRNPLSQCNSNSLSFTSSKKNSEAFNQSIQFFNQSRHKVSRSSGSMEEFMSLSNFKKGSISSVSKLRTREGELS